MAQHETKKPRGRPVEKPMPEPIDDSPENVMRAILATPPKREDEWKYPKETADQAPRRSLSHIFPIG